MISIDELNKKLQENIIFSDLSEEQYIFIFSFAKYIHIQAQKILFHEGDPLDFVYILLDGKLSVNLSCINKKQIIGFIKPGESIGEIAALTDKARSATIIASEHSNLLAFAKGDFLHIISSIPQVLLRISRSLALRSQDLIKQLDKNETSISTTLIIDFQDPISRHFIAKLQEMDNSFVTMTNQPDIESCTKFIDDLSKKQHEIIFIFDIKQIHFVTALIRKINHIYLVSSPSNHNFPENLQENYETIFAGKPYSLVFLHQNLEDKINKGHATNVHRPFHHVFINNLANIQSLLRHVHGRPIGLVLGGGGVKGWVHIGVIKALNELKIPIDMIGGCSSGALAAASYAIDENFDNMLERFRIIMAHVRKPMKISNLSFPIISLFTGKSGTMAMKKIFTQSMEDLLIPFFCISGNMSTYKEVAHITGPVWENLRASIAIPGLLPPMVINDQMHVDGGIINNLPVDRMQSFLGHSAKIIAVSLGGNSSQKRYSFPPFLSNFDLAMHNLKINRKFIFPRFGNFLMNAFLMGASSKEIEARGLADIVIRPEISSVNMIGITHAQEEELIQLGYTQTLIEVEKYGLKNLFSNT